jgi:hypothetical protein
LVSARVYESVHPDITNALIDETSDIELYWNVDDDGTLALGPNRTMTVTTEFLNPTDMSDPAVDILLLQHHIYSPAWPAVGSSWTLNDAASFTTTSVTSDENTLFGDYIIAEPAGTEFWSFQDGDWDDPATWSLSGYEINDPPAVDRWPGSNAGAPSPTDIVYVGNGRRVLVPEGERPNVRFINVENFNDKPGNLAIEGFLGYVEGISFLLEDSCTVEIQHADGFLRGPGNGAIRMSGNYDFGLSRFIYNRPDGSQRTGIGIPDSVKTLIIDNMADLGSNNVFMSVQAGAPPFTMVDSLYIRNGNFIPDGDRINRIGGNAVFKNNGSLDRDKSVSATIWEFTGSTNNVYVGNQIGAEFSNVELHDAGNLNVAKITGVADNAHFEIDGDLTFVDAKNIVLTDDRNLIINNDATNAITGFASDRHIWTGLNTGMLVRSVTADLSRLNYDFPVGVDGDYLPASFLSNIDAGFSDGVYGVAAAKGTNTFIADAHLRVNQVATDVLTKFWIIDTVTTDITGQFSFEYNDPRDMIGTDINWDNVGKWTDPREGGTGEWDTYPSSLVNTTTNIFTSPDNFVAADFLGDWTAGIASAFRRIFYSRQNGLWSDPNSWTFNPSHSGPVYGGGAFPNQNKDSVVIGGDDQINLDGDFTIEGVAVGTGAANIGILNANNFVIGGD